MILFKRKKLVIFIITIPKNPNSRPCNGKYKEREDSPKREKIDASKPIPHDKQEKPNTDKNIPIIPKILFFLLIFFDSLNKT